MIIMIHNNPFNLYSEAIRLRCRETRYSMDANLYIDWSSLYLYFYNKIRAPYSTTALILPKSTGLYSTTNDHYFNTSE